MGISTMANVIFTSPSEFAEGTRRSINNICETGQHYRHLDSATISYPKVVREPLGTITKRDSLNIAVIGGGVGGIASIYELSRLPGAAEKISITLIESDLDHFAFVDRKENRSAVVMRGNRAGRVFAAVSTESFIHKKNSEEHATYEIGAMRFPDLAGLTWHYAKAIYGGKTEVDEFPNPGKVPTEFVQGERVDRYCGNDWLDPKSPTLDTATRVIEGLIGKANTCENFSLFRIGGKDPAKITEELKSPKTDHHRLVEILKEWKSFAQEYNSLTLEAAVRRVVTAKYAELPEVPGLEDCGAKINYYVELFGRYGFGTGGFRPIFNTSLTEMTRLNVWNYSKEYTLPVKKNVMFISELYNKAKEVLGDNLKVRQARVCDICHLDEAAGPGTSAAVLFYENDDTKNIQLEQYDYVIVAVTPKQASAMSTRAGFENKPRRVDLGDYKCDTKILENVRPPFVLSTDPNKDAANSQIIRAINQIHMVPSAKVFVTIKKSEYDANAPTFKNQTIKAVVSDCGLATTYVVPSTMDPDNYYSLLISYTWEDDTKTQLNELGKYPLNIDDEFMLEKVINHTIRDVIEPVDPTSTREKPEYKRWWLGKLLQEAHSKGELTDGMSYDWTTHHTSGGFKLDVTGDHYNSNLLFRYHTHARQAKTLQNRFFLCGDSYSHLGGWIEGAFMSAVNAVCGLIVAANDGDIDSLTGELQKQIITSFDPVTND